MTAKVTNQNVESAMNKIDMRFGESIPTDGNYEIDPLGEFSSFERGLFTYCRDYNCLIHLKAGFQDVAIELFRDIKPHLTYLPKAIFDFADSGRLTIELPELGTSVRLEWIDTNCIFLLDSVSTVVDLTQAVKMIVSLLEDLVFRATTAHYIEQVDADGFSKCLQAALARFLTV